MFMWNSNHSKIEWGDNMSKKTLLIIVIVLLVALIAGVIVGIFIFSNSSKEKKIKPVKTFSITMNDLYCNIKDSKRILKVKITLETTSEKTLENLTSKQFLVRDQVNKIIRSLTDEELQGKEGQVKLQNEIKNNLVELFEDENIINVYFDDFIIQ